MQVGNRGDYSQWLEQRAVDLLGTRLGRRPVDWGPVEDRASDVRKHTTVAWHLVLLTSQTFDSLNPDNPGDSTKGF